MDMSADKGTDPLSVFFLIMDKDMDIGVGYLSAYIPIDNQRQLIYT